MGEEARQESLPRGGRDTGTRRYQQGFEMASRVPDLGIKTFESSSGWQSLENAPQSGADERQGPMGALKNMGAELPLCWEA